MAETGQAAVAEPPDEPHAETPLSLEEQRYAIKTWRYLRLAMIGLTFGLLVSVVYEFIQVDAQCFQKSISAYYYTPVRGYLVGALLSMGTCMFCLKGSTETEDVLLNLAGMFAAVVALVPTPGTGSCASHLGTTAERNADIANNGAALIAVGVFGVVVLAWLARKKLKRVGRGYGVGAALWAAAVLVFVADQRLVVRFGHGVAAGLMFACILIVVCVNARTVRDPAQHWARTLYIAVSGAMVASAVIIGGARLLLGWEHWLIALEAAFIGLFAIFWLVQTIDLWHEGLR